MIKKSIKLLRENPIIILIHLLTVVYAFVNYVVLPDTNQLLASGSLYAFMNPIFWVSMAFNFVYMVGYTILLYPAMQRLIYLLTDNKDTEHWYKKSLKKFWWRGLVVSLMIYVIAMAVMMPVVVVAMIIFAISQSIGWLYFVAAIVVILMIAMMAFSYMAVAAVHAEEDFGEGFSHIFKAGKKYFFRVLPLALVLLIPIGIMIAIAYTNGGDIHGWGMVIMSVFTSLLNAFTAVYCMQLYTEYKNEKLTDAQEAQAEE